MPRPCCQPCASHDALEFTITSSPPYMHRTCQKKSCIPLASNNCRRSAYEGFTDSRRPIRLRGAIWGRNPSRPFSYVQQSHFRKMPYRNSDEDQETSRCPLPHRGNPSTGRPSTRNLNLLVNPLSAQRCTDGQLGLPVPTFHHGGDGTVTGDRTSHP